MVWGSLNWRLRFHYRDHDSARIWVGTGRELRKGNMRLEHSGLANPGKKGSLTESKRKSDEAVDSPTAIRPDMEIQTRYPRTSYRTSGPLRKSWLFMPIKSFPSRSMKMGLFLMAFGSKLLRTMPLPEWSLYWRSSGAQNHPHSNQTSLQECSRRWFWKTLIWWRNTGKGPLARPIRRNRFIGCLLWEGASHSYWFTCIAMNAFTVEKIR